MAHDIADEIIEGRRLKRGDDFGFLTSTDLEVLSAGADKIRRALCGSKGDLCSIINGRSGHCGEDCKFCAQSAHYNTHVKEYAFLPEDEIVEACKRNEKAGANRFSIVTSGRRLSGEEFQKALSAFRAMRAECGVELCASFGLQTEDEFRALKEAGAETCHANLETSRRFFPSICTTHTYDDKIANIRRAQAAGLRVCSGGIIGMGETIEDRIDMALELSELSVWSIPINILRPIPGTPLENAAPLSDEDIIRTVAIFRYINPTTFIRIAAGRNRFPDGGEVLFRSGANSAITGDMLTTSGNKASDDTAMFRRLGYSI